MISTGQLNEVGLDRNAITRRKRDGWLHPLYRGVYACSPAPLSFMGRCWAAILACGGPDAATLSYRTAAALDDLMNTPSGRIDVTTLRRSASTRGLRVHVSRTLAGSDIVRDADGLPRTTVARTLADLASVLTPHQLRRACHRAEHLRLIDMRAIEAQRPSRKLRAGLQELTVHDPAMTRSDLEEALLALLDAHELPRPIVNTILNGHEVDFHWPEQKLIVETDGAATHLTRTAFQDDRTRDVQHTIAGYRVARFTHSDVIHRPEKTGRALRALLTFGS